MLTTSDFFSKGFYKKAQACPEKYTKGKKPAIICGKTITEKGKWDPSTSFGKCPVDVSTDNPAIVETKFNGNRGIFEFRNGDGCFFTNKTLCLQKPIPRETSKLLVEYLEKKGVKDVILDGEMFLEKCVENGVESIPPIGMQTEAIKGDHPEVLDTCTFTFKLFDIVQLDGKDVWKEPLSKRKEILQKLIPTPIMGKVTYDPATDDYTVLPAGKAGKNVSIDPVIPVPWKKGKPAPVATTATDKDEIVDFVCEVTGRGEEGAVIKDPDGEYTWLGATESSANKIGWWKLKQMLDIDAEVFEACLGNKEKTYQHALRYRNLHLGACENDDCTKLAEITERGVSLTTNDGDFHGEGNFDALIHDPIVQMIKNGAATQLGTDWVHVDDAMAAPLPYYKREKFEQLAGKVVDPATGKTIDPGIIDPNIINPATGLPDTIGLPSCVALPLHALIVSVVTQGVNPPKATKGKSKSKKGKYPTLQGPTKLSTLRDDKGVPNSLQYVEGFIT